MAKRLNTEKKIKRNGFNIKIGTTNRLNPNTVYIDLGGYITPQEEKKEYSEDILSLNKMLNHEIKANLRTNNEFDKKYICVIETASERMKMGKKSYISLQCHLKQQNCLDTNEILQATDEFITNLSPVIINTIEYNGFSVN